MKQEFIKRWSVWWTLHKDKQLLDEAFAKELDELIEQNPNMNSHKEKIKCPECGNAQEAEVLHTEPFSTYLHDCIRCNYTITESEWECVNEHKKVMTATEFWQNKFGEAPKTDRDKLTCALMQEYYQEINK
jgi:ribosomal protein S27E